MQVVRINIVTPMYPWFLPSSKKGHQLQEEYKLEGIDWSYIEFVDNQDCLDLLEGGPGNPSLAIFPLIDEACRLPKATYEVSPLQIHYSLRLGIKSIFNWESWKEHETLWQGFLCISKEETWSQEDQSLFGQFNTWSQGPHLLIKVKIML